MAIPTASQLQRIKELTDQLGGLSPTEQEAAIEALECDSQTELLVLAEVKFRLRTRLTIHSDEEIDGHEIKEEIGRGGMGVVYLAADAKNNRKVALKTISDRLLESADDIEAIKQRFMNEATAFGNNDRHVGIPLVYKTGTFFHERSNSQVPYFTMELIRGKSLSDWAKTNSSAADILQVMHKICEAVQYAHQHRIMHLDLKPDNILVDSHDQPMILDFGLHEFVESSPPARQSWTLPGTPLYKSPEQVTDDFESGMRHSDQYSLAVILYELLAGKLPYEFPGDSSTEVRKTITVEKCRPLKPRHLPISSALNRALEKNPAKRFRSVEEFGTALLRARRWYLPGTYFVGTLALIFLLIAGTTLRDRMQMGDAAVEQTHNQQIEQGLDTLATADSLRREGNAAEAETVYRELINKFTNHASVYSAQSVTENSSATARRNFGWCRYGVVAATIGLSKTFSEHNEDDVRAREDALAPLIVDIEKWAVQYARLNPTDDGSDEEIDGLFVLLKAMALCEKARLSHQYALSESVPDVKNALKLLEQLRPIENHPRIKRHFQEAEGTTRFVQAMILMLSGQYSEAVEPIAEAEDLFVAAGDNVNKVTSAIAHADALAETGDEANAIVHYDYAINECRFSDRDGVDRRYWFRLSLAKALANSSRIVAQQENGGEEGLSRIREARRIVKGDFSNAPPSFRTDQVLLASHEFQSIHTEVLLSAMEYLECAKFALTAISVLKHGPQSVQRRIAVCWMNRATALVEYLKQHPEELDAYESEVHEAFEAAVVELEKWQANPWYMSRLRECKAIRTEWDQFREALTLQPQ